MVASCHFAYYSASTAATLVVSAAANWVLVKVSIVLVDISTTSSLTRSRELRQILVLSMTWLRHVWLWGIRRVETGQVPPRRRGRSMLLLPILVRAIRWLLHLRKWKGKRHPSEVVVRHCDRSAARRGRSFARSSGHRLVGYHVNIQKTKGGLQQFQCARLHFARWLVDARRRRW